jgi:hypothetical protein
MDKIFESQSGGLRSRNEHRYPKQLLERKLRFRHAIARLRPSRCVLAHLENPGSEEREAPSPPPARTSTYAGVAGESAATCRRSLHF